MSPVGVLLAALGAFLFFTVGLVPPTSGQELPPGPKTIHRSSHPVESSPAAFETIQMVMDFAPGAWTPPHFHSGETFVLVLDGQMTVRVGENEQVYGPGEGWRELPYELHVAGNGTGENARIMVTFLLPKGAQLTTVAASAP